MPRYKITSRARILTYQYIEAENAEKAREVYDDSDLSAEQIIEESVDDIEFWKIEEVQPRKRCPSWPHNHKDVGCDK